MIRRLLLGLAAGLLAGTWIGLVESLWVLTASGAPSEYVALFYAVVLYGLIGLVLGLGVGVGLALVGLLTSRLADVWAWTWGFMGVFLPLGGIITFHSVDRVVYLERGVPMPAQGVLWLLGAVAAAVGFWILPILLTRTPLKMLLRLKGTATLWGGVLLLAAVFSFAPGGPNPNGTMRPVRTQDPALQARPNVLVVVVDSLRADHVGAFGRWPEGQTPVLDGLATESFLFEQAFAASSWTRPATASLLTSMLPSSHRVNSEVAVLPADVTTLAEALQQAGWVTGGLTNSIDLTRTFNFQQGFDFFRYQSPDYLFGATESASQLSLYAVVRDLRARLLARGLRITDYYQPAAVVLHQARAFVEAQGDDRWFLFVHLMEPHEPYFTQPPDGSGISRATVDAARTPGAEVLSRAYADEVAALDRQLKSFMDWLRETAWDQTLVVVTADHGETLLDHGDLWHGTSLHDEQLRVPLIIKPSPGGQGPVRVPWQVRTLDLAPTIAGQVGVPPAPRWQGRDLLGPELRGGQDRLAREESQRRAVAAGEPGAVPPPRREPGVHPEDRVVIAELDHAGVQSVAIRHGGWKYIKALPGSTGAAEPEQLFHVSADPRERTNLAGGAGVVQARLDQRLSEALLLAAERAVSSRDPALDDAASERMRALGDQD